MSKRNYTLYIVDILIAYNKIKRYINKFDNAQELLHSELEWDATIRELQIIGEATNILLKYDFLNKSFRQIVDFRNQITHGYFGVDEEIVWEVINKKIDEFINEMIKQSKSKSINLDSAINCAIEENSFNQKVVLYLKEFLKVYNEK